MDTELLAGMIARPLVYAALIAIAFAPLERLAPLRAPDRKSAGIDILFATAGGIVVEVLQLFVAGALLSLAETVGQHGPLRAMHVLPRVAIALVLFELGGYAYHRLAHAWPPLFALHRVHHESTSMDWLASFRQHPLEIALMTMFQNLPLVLLGMPLGGHALIAILLRVATVYVHANLRTPRAIEPFIATPRFHHRHHDRDAPGANYASLFPWIDRAFGTYDSEDARIFGL